MSYRQRDYLRLNRKLFATTNPRQPVRFLVVENTPLHLTDYRLSTNQKNFEVIQGSDKPLRARMDGSYHHAAGLNSCLPHLSSKFALFMDPDFFIVRPEWVKDVLDHMKRMNLTFFGVPWHPRWVEKYRHFPCVHCLFVNLENISVNELDFTPTDSREAPQPPGLDGSGETTSQESFRHRLRLAGTRPSRDRLDRSIARLKKYLLRLLPSWRRRLIGRSGDTGSAIHSRFAHRRELNSECLIPVFEPNVDLGDLIWVNGSRFLEFFLPQQLHYLPPAQTYSTHGFRENGGIDARGQGYEEFLWRGQPFGFHLRGSRANISDPREKAKEIESLLGELTSNYHPPCEIPC